MTGFGIGGVNENSSAVIREISTEFPKFSLPHDILVSTMTPQLIILIAAMIISPLLFVMGRELWGMKSVKGALQAYEDDPRLKSFTRDWLLGWRWVLQRSITRWSYDVLGDRFGSGFYRVAGGFFLVVLVLLWISFPILLAQ